MRCQIFFVTLQSLIALVPLYIAAYMRQNKGAKCTENWPHGLEKELEFTKVVFRRAGSPKSFARMGCQSGGPEDLMLRSSSPCPRVPNAIGEMLEWLKRHAWKACKLQKGFRGSNPRLSARQDRVYESKLAWLSKHGRGLDRMPVQTVGIVRNNVT